MTTSQPGGPSPVAHRPAVPYDDLDAFHRRWGHLDDDERRQVAEEDPLGFIADHLPSYDRAEGTVVVLLDGLPDGQRLVNVVADGPLNPEPDECRRLLETFAEAAHTLVLEEAELLDGEGLESLFLAIEMGVLVHRRGPERVTAEDRRWSEALRDVQADWGLGSLGVLARTESGALVRVTGCWPGQVA